jgi:hypothetical protein
MLQQRHRFLRTFSPHRVYGEVFRWRVEEAGVSVSRYKRAPGSPIYRLVRAETGVDRKSLGHTDRELTVEQAKALAARLSELRYAGDRGAVTMGQLVDLYERERVPILTAATQRNVRGMLRLLKRHRGILDEDDPRTYLCRRVLQAPRQPKPILVTRSRSRHRSHDIVLNATSTDPNPSRVSWQHATR